MSAATHAQQPALFTAMLIHSFVLTSPCLTRSAMVAVLQMCRGFVVTRRITGKIHTLPSTTPCTAGIKTGRVRAFILCPS